VWVADSMVTVEGPVWAVPEVTNIPAAPPAPPTKAPPPTVAPTPTFAWPFRAESVQSYPGDNILRVNAIVYNGAVPLWGYKLKIRRLSTGEEWLSGGSNAGWDYEVIQFPTDGERVVPSFDCPVIKREGLQCAKYNLKWDGNQVSAPPGDDDWEVSLADGGGQTISAPVRVQTRAADPKWYHVVFTLRSCSSNLVVTSDPFQPTLSRARHSEARDLVHQAGSSWRLSHSFASPAWPVR
jgi:hypothetical protein